MLLKRIILFTLFLFEIPFMQIDWKIINSNNEKLVIEFLTLNNETKHIKPIQILIGLPNNKIPNIKTTYLYKSNFTQISKKKI